MSQPPLPANSRLQAIALATAFPLIMVWGVNFSLQKYVFNVFSPPGFLFARYLVLPACALAFFMNCCWMPLYLFRTFFRTFPTQN